MRENLVQSILSDLFTFGCLFSGFFVNHYFLDKRWYIDVFFMIFCLLIGIAKTTTKKFTNKKDLIDHLNKEEDELQSRR